MTSSPRSSMHKSPLSVTSRAALRNSFSTRAATTSTRSALSKLAQGETNPMTHFKSDGAGLGTRAVWSGEQGDRWTGATQVSVAFSVSFGYKTVEEWLEVAQGKQAGHIY